MGLLLLLLLVLLSLLLDKLPLVIEPPLAELLLLLNLVLEIPREKFELELLLKRELDETLLHLLVGFTLESENCLNFELLLLPLLVLLRTILGLAPLVGLLGLLTPLRLGLILGPLLLPGVRVVLPPLTLVSPLLVKVGRLPTRPKRLPHTETSPE